MQRKVLTFISAAVLIVLVTACSPGPVKNWTQFIHEKTAFLLLPEEGTTLSTLSGKNYIQYFDELSPAPIQQLVTSGAEFPSNLTIKAVGLYPSASTESHILWISSYNKGNFDAVAKNYYEPFSQNNYNFFGYRIHRLLINKNAVYAVQVGEWLLFSNASIVVENALRTSLNILEPMQLEHPPQSGSFILNTPSLDHWAEQFAIIKHRPSLINALRGTKPAELTFSTSTDTLNNIQISGRIPLQDDVHSVLTDAFSFENKPVQLDRHIGSNAAAFAILRLPPVAVPKQPAGQILSELDSLFLNDMNSYQQLVTTVGDEFAFVSFPESGLSNNGEYLFLRNLRDKNRLIRQLDELAEQEMLYKVQDSYHINSVILSELFGSELAAFHDMYLSFSGNVAVVGKRRGLVESVNADRIRRRVIYYDETYSNIRREMPNQLSGFMWISSTEFLNFLEPFLKPDNILGSIAGRFDIISITMEKNDDAVEMQINTFKREGSAQPYEELWVLPLSNTNLTSAPVLGDLVGSSMDEIVFAADDGRVFALASDGTITTQVSTNGIRPIGAPVLYDWYGNGQLNIMLAAGNKIFAWNASGELLPKFPMELNAAITSPILVGDILRNGIPEIVVATEDRKVHVLDGRGENVSGWPQNTNTTVTSKPAYQLFEGSWSLWVFSENALHSWMRNGVSRPEFPQFINAQFTGEPVFFKNQILGSAADGYLYSIGRKPFFSDSAAVADSLNEIKVQSHYVAGQELTSVSVEENVLLRGENGFYREDLIATQSANGSVFLYNQYGELRFTQSLGQPASSSFKPQLLDIDGDRNMDLIALAEFGRLYAWTVLTNERLYDIPTSGMKYPIFVDLNKDGNWELIAQTREGLRSWTIRRTE